MDSIRANEHVLHAAQPGEHHSGITNPSDFVTFKPLVAHSFYERARFESFPTAARTIQLRPICASCLARSFRRHFHRARRSETFRRWSGTRWTLRRSARGLPDRARPGGSVETEFRRSARLDLLQGTTRGQSASVRNLCRSGDRSAGTPFRSGSVGVLTEYDFDTFNLPSDRR